jgi:hypothetical protein
LEMRTSRKAKPTAKMVARTCRIGTLWRGAKTRSSVLGTSQ